MGMGIEKSNVFDTWSVPLNAYKNNVGSDNTWLVDHLRQLADKIEKENPSIYSISFETNANLNAQLVVKVFNS